MRESDKVRKLAGALTAKKDRIKRLERDLAESEAYIQKLTKEFRITVIFAGLFGIAVGGMLGWLITSGRI